MKLQGDARHCSMTVEHGPRMRRKVLHTTCCGSSQKTCAIHALCPLYLSLLHICHMASGALHVFYPQIILLPLDCINGIPLTVVVSHLRLNAPGRWLKHSREYISVFGKGKMYISLMRHIHCRHFLVQDPRPSGWYAKA